MYLNKIFENVEPKNVFLTDCIGGMVSVLYHGYFLVNLVKLIGMPVLTLKCLAFTACGFALYSFACFLFSGTKWRLLMKIVASANLIYCTFTLGLLFYFSSTITVLGIILFGVEIAVISMLAYAEWKKASS